MIYNRPSPSTKTTFRQFIDKRWLRFREIITWRNLRKNGWRYALYFIGGIIALLGLLFLLTWLGAFGKVPSKAVVKAIRQPEASKIYSVDEKLMGKYYTKNRNT